MLDHAEQMLTARLLCLSVRKKTLGSVIEIHTANTCDSLKTNVNKQANYKEQATKTKYK